MRKFSIAALFAVGTMIGASPVIAQTTRLSVERPMTNSKLLINSGETPTTRARNEDLVYNNKSAAVSYSEAQSVARCVVAANSKRAAALVGGPGTSDPTYSKLNSAMTMRLRSCVRDARGIVVPMLLSGAVAEQLLRSETGAYDDRAKLVNVDVAAKFHGNLGAQIALDAISRCQAVYSPGLAHKVLRTEVGSSAEASALATLYAKTGECGAWEAPASVPRSYQRAAVAQGLYLWTHKNG